MEIIDYDSKYDEEIKDLLVELHKYIISIDKEQYHIFTNEYREIEFKKTINEITDKDGKMFLAFDKNKVIGLIVGIINNEGETTYEFKAPKRGRITELIVTKEYRSKGVGQKLINVLEKHFKSVGCKAIIIEVFAYNENAKKFYYKNNYHDRCLDVIKDI
jgi:ribosomal protein S18 acetylase RimI-like enzyme